MVEPRIVVDTNVLVSALRSRRGASFRLLALVGTGVFKVALSVPLVLEYEEVLHRLAEELRLTQRDVQAVIDYLCSVGHKQRIFYLWRPQLRDADDDMVLELAVAAECRCIVTVNERDFHAATRFGLRVRSPQAFLQEIGELP